MTFNIRLWTLLALAWAALVVSDARAELVDAGTASLAGSSELDAGTIDAGLDLLDVEPRWSR